MLVFVSGSYAAIAHQKPDILRINCDDLGVELSCYGNTDVKTPNIDRLASQRVRFTNAHAASPVCSPSRSSLIAGMYPPFNQFMASRKPEIELYDLKSDPMEFNNLAGNHKYESIKNQLYQTLVDSLKKFEKNMIPEKPETIQKAKASSASYFQAGMKKIGMSDQSTSNDPNAFTINK